MIRQFLDTRLRLSPEPFYFCTLPCQRRRAAPLLASAPAASGAPGSQRQFTFSVPLVRYWLGCGSPDGKKCTTAVMLSKKPPVFLKQAHASSKSSACNSTPTL